MSDDPGRFSRRCWQFMLWLFIVAFLVGLMLPSVKRGARPHARSSQCRNNLKQIGLALMNYHDTFGSFPSAYIPDAEGHPNHSWRTLILVWLDQGPLYTKYRFDEAWDGPNNQELRSHNISVLNCPSDPTIRAGRTNYVAVVGPNTAWPGARTTNLKDSFPDGAENTILVVEVADSGIDWIEPRDLNFDDMSFQLNAAARDSISSQHLSKGSWPWSRDVHIVNALFADGHVEKLPLDTPPELIRALLTVNGGEVHRRNTNPAD